jgi:RHS repeat-associated protein
MDYTERVSAASPGAVTKSSRSVRGESDTETGLYYYRARYYDPIGGRFLTEDPAAFTGGLNLYSYVRGNPTRYVDPFGLWTIQVGLTINVALSGGGGMYSRGIVIDGDGRIGWFHTWGAGLAEGAGFSGGVSFAYSNAHTICGIGGPFGQASGTGGYGGAAATGDYFYGPGDGPKGWVQGAGGTIGLGGGAGASALVTTTYVHPFGNCECDKKGIAQPR